MNLDIDTKNKIVYIIDIDLSSEELTKLAKRFEGYTFKQQEEHIPLFEENDDINGTTIVFADNTLLAYNTPISCNCEDKNYCEKLNKCNNKYLN